MTKGVVVHCPICDKDVGMHFVGGWWAIAKDGPRCGCKLEPEDLEVMEMECEELTDEEDYDE